MNRRTFFKTMILGSGVVLIGPQALLSVPVDKKTVKIVMLYNNVEDSRDFLCEWGLSIWVEDHETAVMFDTGQTPSMLWNNMTKLNIDLGKLSKVLISHNHVDHKGGLGMVLDKAAQSPEVFAPQDDLGAFQKKHANARITGVDQPVQITEKIWSTGSLGGFLKEQAMILTRDDAMIVMTGCAHPGIVEIVEKAKAIHPGKELSLVMGGFHFNQFSDDVVLDISNRLKKLGVKRISPSHCTGTKAISVFEKEWKENFFGFGAGDSTAS